MFVFGNWHNYKYPATSKKYEFLCKLNQWNLTKYDVVIEQLTFTKPYHLDVTRSYIEKVMFVYLVILIGIYYLRWFVCVIIGNIKIQWT